MTSPETMAVNLDGHGDSAGPVRGTQGVLRIGMIWLAANLVVTTLLTGTLFVPAVSFGTASAMIVIGTLIGVVVLTLVGNMGTRTGLPTMAMPQFEPSNRETWVSFTPSGSEAVSTAKPWFIDTISTLPVV